MNVKTILAVKGRDVIGVERTEPLSAAVQLLAKHRIGALVVFIARGGLAGILSERDIVRALAEHGAGALEKEVRYFMTPNVETCTENDTVADLMERMTEGKFRHLPVLVNARVAGIVSIGDIVKQRVEEIEREGEALRDYIRTA